MRRVIAIGTILAALTAASRAQDDTVQGHTAAAKALAQRDPSGVVARAAGQCPGVGSGSTGAPEPYPLATHLTPLPPTRVFDNLYFVGDDFVGAWIVQTDQGLILIDAFGNGTDAQRYATADMKQLGLDAKQIKYVVITHGHWDHFGGAGYFQMRLGARVVMGKPDWDRLPLLDQFGVEIEGQMAPKRDIAMADPTMDLTLGNTTVKLMLTPGHSPGTISALIPAREGSTMHWLALWGGNAFQRALNPTEKNGVVLQAGLRRMHQSVREFREWIATHEAVGVISTHMAGERRTRFAALGSRAPGGPNPFVLGKERTQDYFTALDHCMQARMIEASRR